MKSYIVYFLVFLLIAPIVLAGVGRTIDLDFSQEPRYVVIMLEGDRVKFNALNGEHTIIVHDIKDTSEGQTVELEIYPYYKNLEEGNVNYVTLNSKANTVKIDLDKNGVHDLKISVAQVGDKKALLVFEQINEKYMNNVTGRVLNTQSKSFYQDKNFIIAGVVGLVLLIVILSLILRKKRK